MKQLSVFLIIAILSSCSNPQDHNVGNIDNVALAVISKNDTQNDTSQKATKEFNKHWYDGKAELTSYKLSQARYGEIHEGHAVSIFVTEEFLPKKQLKADRHSDNNVPILKFNNTKKFLTGIYPYSLMTSTFSPIESDQHAIKTTFSAQEWCGHTYIQLNNRNQYDVMAHSYFETNGDQKFQLKKQKLEDDVWTQIRIAPEKLPVGNFKMIPALEYVGMNHKTLKAYDAKAVLKKEGSFQLYQLEYPDLKRVLTIKFSTDFPYIIESWEESFPGPYDQPGTQLRTKAERLETLRTAYWSQNKVVDQSIRKQLGL